MWIVPFILVFLAVTCFAHRQKSLVSRNLEINREQSDSMTMCREVTNAGKEAKWNFLSEEVEGYCWEMMNEHPEWKLRQRGDQCSSMLIVSQLTQEMLLCVPVSATGETESCVWGEDGRERK